MPGRPPRSAVDARWEAILAAALADAGVHDEALARDVAAELPVELATPAVAELLAERHERVAAVLRAIARGLADHPPPAR